MIGAIAGGGKGAAIGATVGAGAGAGSVFIQGRNDLELKTGAEFRIRARSRWWGPLISSTIAPHGSAGCARELVTPPEFERRELTAIYVARGLTPTLATQVADQLMAHDAPPSHVATVVAGSNRSTTAATFGLLRRAGWLKGSSCRAGGAKPPAPDLDITSKQALVIMHVS